MVVQQRSELGRNRTLYFLTIVLSVAILAGVVLEYPENTEPVQIALVLLAAAAAFCIALSAIQLYGYPKRSQVLLFHLEDRMIVATNNRHEGYKMRFLETFWGDSVSSFSDEERAHWKTLEADGYYPALYIRKPRKILMLRLCTMVFDDVFVADVNDRWEHHNASNTSEPTFSNREMPPLKAWKGSSKISA